MVVRVLKTAVLNLVKLDHRGIRVEAVDSFLVLNEVLNAAKGLAHASDRLCDGDVHVHDFALPMTVRAILSIRRVCKAFENIQVFARTSLAKRSLMAHAK